jgi:RNA polymerase sigma-70 factor (ECF subfamily)
VWAGSYHPFRVREHLADFTHPIDQVTTLKSASPGPASAIGDAGLAERVAGGDQAAFELLMRRHNGRLFRVARAILRDDSDAEDALQDAYLDAYQHMTGFRGGSQLSTWLTRLVINRALMRLRKQKRDRVVVPFQARGRADGENPEAEVADHKAESPPDATLRAEVRLILERRIDELPVAFRTVFVMREVEDMTIQDIAECLSIPPSTVRTRLFRARALLREALARDMDAATAGVFGFAGERCDRIVAAVLARARTPQEERGTVLPPDNREY